MHHEKEHRTERKHHEIHPRTRKLLERHHKKLEKMEMETKKHLGMHTGGEVMKIRDRHEPRATEHGIREKRNHSKRK